MPNAYYLKLGSGNEQVPGTSRDRYHVGWIKLTSFCVGDGKRQPSGAGAVGHGKTTVSEVTLSKLADRASTAISLATSQGRAFRSAVIEIADEKSGVPKLRLTLTDVMIESFSANANGGFGGGQSETFTLNFAAAQWNHNPVAEESVGQMLQTSSYSLELARGH